MRILLTSPGTHPWSPTGIGGGPITVHKYAEKLALRGHQVWVVFPSWERRVEHPQLPYTPVFIPRRRHFLLCWDIARVARRLAGKESIDIVHTIGWQGAFVHRACRGIVPGVGSTHLPEVPEVGVLDLLQGGWRSVQAAKNLLDRMNCRSARAAIAISQYARKQVIARYKMPGEKVYVVYSGIDASRITGESSLLRGEGESGAPHLLFVGRLSAEKGIEDLLETARRLKGRGLDFTLDVVGPWPPGSKAAAEALMRRYQDVQDRVMFHGGVAPEQVDAFYRQARALVHPSRMESFGLVFVEAMAKGIPVVGYRAGAAPEVVEEEVAGFLAPVGDVGALTEATARLLTTPAEARRLGKAGPAQAAKFTWEKSAERLEQVYQAVLG